ncbi:MAG TPA: hypothetical protein VMM18_08760 [Gemmatimonadaceae bacterium]|nr:hypothetical protein [Gemmatimonadaceae bacterium]
MIGLIVLATTALVTYLAYRRTRRFVGERLRFVDAVQRTSAPWIAGVATTVLALPVVPLLPYVSVGTAIVLGVSVGLGVARGARDARVSTGYELRPIPRTF